MKSKLMKPKKLVFGISLSLLCSAAFSLVGCATDGSRSRDEAIARADRLLDSTFHYYQVEGSVLFNENYPKQEGESVSYLAGEDTVTQDKVAYLWPTSGLFSGVNALLRATGDKKYLRLLEEVILPGLDCYYDTTRTPACYQSYLSRVGHSDRFYDDNIWLGIDFLESYELTGKAEYLSSARAIWTFIESGRDSILGDGVYWCEQKRFSKNTCSNAPAAVLALKLYQTTKEDAYLQAGKELYHWTQQTLQDPSDGLYFDNKSLDGRIGKAKFAYNSGQMMQAAALLYLTTKDGSYLDEARRLAEACNGYFFRPALELGPGLNGLRNGNVWFSAILFRGYEELYRIDGNKSYLDNFRATLDYVWKTNRNPDGLMDNDRFVDPLQSPQSHKWLLTQAAFVEMYARLSLIH